MFFTRPFGSNAGHPTSAAVESFSSRAAFRGVGSKCCLRRLLWKPARYQCHSRACSGHVEALCDVMPGLWAGHPRLLCGTRRGWPRRSAAMTTEWFRMTGTALASAKFRVALPVRHVEIADLVVRRRAVPNAPFLIEEE